jgi:hypothetical protein
MGWRKGILVRMSKKDLVQYKLEVCAMGIT